MITHRGTTVFRSGRDTYFIQARYQGSDLVYVLIRTGPNIREHDIIILKSRESAVRALEQLETIIKGV